MNQKRKINFKKLITRLSIFIILILFAIRLFLITNNKKGINIGISSLLGFNTSSEYDIIKQDENKNYLGKRTRKRNW